MPILPNRNNKHCQIGAEVEYTGRDIDHIQIETFSRSFWQPNLPSRTAAEDGDEEEYDVECDIQRVKALQNPVERISFDGTEDSKYEEDDGDFDEGDCRAI